MSEINKIVAGIGDAILEATKRSKAELKAYIDRELDTHKFSGTQIKQNTIPGLALTNFGVPTIKIRGLQAEIVDIAVAEIASATIDYAQINNVRIKTADIDDAAITTAKISDAAITSAKIGDAEIGTAKIANAAIKTANIDLGAITTALIQEGAVGSVQIADGSITDAKIVELTANKITAGELSVERLVISGTDKSIVYALNNMGDLVSTAVDTIDGDTLTPRTITADKIVAESITSNEMSANSITTNNIVALAVTADKIAANAITANKIDAGAITADKIAAGAITAEKLAAESVTADKIAAGAINAGHLDAENIFAENANIQELIAENLDTEKFFAREGVVNNLTANYITPLNDAITIKLNEQSIFTGPVAPGTPIIDKKWLDTSTNPEQLKRWTGTEWAIVSKSKTDGYISMGTIKMPGGGTEFGVAVGEGVDALDGDGEIPTTERSMSVQTAKAYMILTGGEQVFDVDATGADAKSFRGESVVIDGAWVETTTPTKGFVLKWGG